MTADRTSWLLSFARNRLIPHLLFWALAFYVLLNLFSTNSELAKVDYIYTAIFLFTLIVAVYINLVFLIPELLRKGRYLLYAGATILLVLSGTYFNFFLFDSLIDYILPGYYFISYYSLFDICKFFVVFIAATTLLKLSKEWFQLIKSKQRLIEIEKQKIEIELKALRSQVNPHFLFNSLNVLYLLALEQAEETPEAIIKLSDILRYVIYDSNKDRVKLESEIQLIHNYLSLQEHRTDQSAEVLFQTDIKGGILIAPMLFLPLVENSFKHGVKGALADTYVHIHLAAKDKILHFDIENNKGSIDKASPQEGGVGLSNIRQRLQFLYPGKHEFTILEKERSFKVTLKLNYED